jgi:acetyl-CoA acetyltransferase
MYTTAEFALIARRHMAVYGTTPRQMATVAATIRNNGSRNPEAVYYGRGPYTIDDILASRMIADPYHLLDCAMTSEGGCAIILTTRERARDLKQKPAYLLGCGIEGFVGGYTHPPTIDSDLRVGERASRLAFGQAGLVPSEVDVCELYDNFSGEILRYLELVGFCGQGEGGPFVESGAIAPGGMLPITTHGGTMSHSHTQESQLLGMVVEAVRQIRGTSTGHQVPNVDVALACNLAHQVLLLGREPAS